MEYTTTLAPADLLAAFAEVPDPRRRQGRRYPLAAILTLAVAAIVANHGSVLAIAEWGANQSAEMLTWLGFPQGQTPHQSTLTRLFQRLEPAAVTMALSAYVEPAARAAAGRGRQGIAIDGKAQRGRLAFAGDPQTPVQELAAYCHDRGIVLAQVPVTGTADKAEAELTVAPDLLAQLDWHNRVLTGDALYCQRTLCQQVLDAGGDYLFLVKANQPALFDDLRILFDPPFARPPLTDARDAQTIDQGHGRYDDTRTLIASTDLIGYTRWPGLAQVFRLERTWWANGKRHRTLRYGITSLPPTVASAERLLALRRGHWTIENQLHWVKDVSLGEDRSTVHRGVGPTIMATLRDTAVSVLHQAGRRRIAASLRYFSQRPREILALLGLAPSENA